MDSLTHIGDRAMDLLEIIATHKKHIKDPATILILEKMQKIICELLLQGDDDE